MLPYTEKKEEEEEEDEFEEKYGGSNSIEMKIMSFLQFFL
jgi:hypothetical protein